MSEGQNPGSKDLEKITTQASSLATVIRRSIDGEFAEVFAPDYEIGLSSAADTLKDEEGNVLGNLLADRIIRPESKDLILTFAHESDPELASETVRFRISRYGGVTPYYEYFKVFNGEKGSPEPLRNNEEAENAIREFGLKISKMLGIPQEE